MKPHRFLPSIWLLLLAGALTAAAAPLPDQSDQLLLTIYSHERLSPAQPAPPQQPQIFHVAGNVQTAKLIHCVTPIYPPSAEKAGIRGTVIVEMLIPENGGVASLGYVSGPHEVVGSTMEVVREWRYRPTTLNGRRVMIDTEIGVTYSLGKSLVTGADSSVRLQPPPRPQFPPMPAPKVIPMSLMLIRSTAEKE